MYFEYSDVYILNIQLPVLFVEPWLLSSEPAEFLLNRFSRGHDLPMSRAGDIKGIYT